MTRSSQTALIAALAVPSFMVGSDFTGAMLIVLPVSREFGADISTTGWILNAYALAVGAMVVAGGRLADTFGRRRAHLAGLALTFAGSLACALAPTIASLIAARVLQGAGIALVVPATMAIGATSVAVHRRGAVVGMMLGAIAIGNITAPFLAGAALALGDWRWFFGFNALLAVLSAPAALAAMADDRPQGVREPIDFAGMALSALALFLPLYALDLGADLGFAAPQVQVLASGTVVAVAAFVLVEQHVGAPMLPPETMRNDTLLSALVLQGLPATTLFVILMYVPRHFEMSMGWSPSGALLAVVPCLVTLAITNSTAGHLFNLVGPRALSLAGHALVAGGMLVAALAMPGASYGLVVACLSVATLGVGMILGPMATGAVNAEPPERAGLVGGLNFSAHLAVGAFGLAIATAVITILLRGALPEALEAAGVTVPAGAEVALQHVTVGGGDLAHILPEASRHAAEAVAQAAAKAYASGLGGAFWVCALLAALGVGLSARLNDRRLGRVSPSWS